MIAAFEAQGYAVTSTVRNEVFARLLLTGSDGAEPDKLEMAVDWRAHPPVASAVGPVLHADDAVANKMCALFSRAESRDFLDVDAAISSGRYSREALIELAHQADPGFDAGVFATALQSLERITDTDFAEYQVSPERLAALRADFADWARVLRRSAT
ncbi:nucleotidyl transferase AbiEii/AbiGii toxin family protein [Catellatospora sp. NPDC049111]|uniref:nucleotidyl transferase AbiEii/AbiGii toxin family protein n=1 Tax=Catellatospora sp. NPDC049111 TaxID=3155271 RepID=UPI0033FCFE50